MTREFWIVRGKVTCPDVAEIFGVTVGADEYQFSDGPAGHRSTSYDFASIEDGIKALSPAVFHLDEDE